MGPELFDGKPGTVLSAALRNINLMVYIFFVLSAARVCPAPIGHQFYINRFHLISSGFLLPASKHFP
jgi:hypothetical protein